VSEIHEYSDAALHNNLFTVGYTTSDVLYRWNSRAVAISEDLRMSQFDLIGVPSSNDTISVGIETQSNQQICE